MQLKLIGNKNENIKRIIKTILNKWSWHNKINQSTIMEFSNIRYYNLMQIINPNNDDKV